MKDTESPRIPDIPPREPASDPIYIKHIHCEGARYHALSWDSKGAHCSESKCIVNKRAKEIK